LSNELSHLMDAIVLIYVISLYLYEEPEALSYEIFMWGDVGLVTDVRYYSVAPHWYFRPFMAWLIACPYHRIGVFGLVLFFIVLFYQPGLHGASDQDIYSRRVLISPHSNLPLKNVYNFNRLTEELNLGHQLMFGFFVGCLLYVSSYLPYGRFYNRLGGNIGMLLAYIYVLMYLTFPRIRRSLFSDIFFVFYYKRVYFISHLVTPSKCL
jgi:hypothetical protein